jgi:transketolase N-terminal domain/subunit
MDLLLRKRLLKLLFDHKEEHVGSCFTCLDIIDKIFEKKNNEDIFILSNGHAAFALYVVLEKYYKHINADELVKKHGGHPNHDEKNHIYCSTGSLGSGIAIALGRALANPSRKVFVTISDGEAAEGVVWETLRYIEEYKVKNIEVHVNLNGWACYDAIDSDYLERRLKAFLPSIVIHRTDVNEFSFTKDLDAHYYRMNEKDFLNGLGELDERQKKIC